MIPPTNAPCRRTWWQTAPDGCLVHTHGHQARFEGPYCVMSCTSDAGASKVAPQYHMQTAIGPSLVAGRLDYADRNGQYSSTITINVMQLLCNGTMPGQRSLHVTLSTVHRQGREESCTGAKWAPRRAPEEPSSTVLARDRRTAAVLLTAAPQLRRAFGRMPPKLPARWRPRPSGAPRRAWRGQGPRHGTRDEACRRWSRAADFLQASRAAHPWKDRWSGGLEYATRCAQLSETRGLVTWGPRLMRSHTWRAPL